MKKIAISVGDVNGIGLEILLKAHNRVKNLIKPFYVIDFEVLECGAKILKYNIPKDLEIIPIKEFCSTNLKNSINNNTLIKPSILSKESGEYSFISFKEALNLAIEKKIDGILTLPINKFAWNKAGVNFLGHTEYLSYKFNKKGIMMLGCKEMFVALFSDHIPLKDVSRSITFQSLSDFLLDFKRSFTFKEALVLGLNPHAGDGGILGNEDFIIKEAIDFVNKKLNSKIFIGPISPDSAFNPNNRSKYNIFVSMYHDQGLAPLKALYFEKSINVTLGIPILRSSVDHGTGFDIAYKGKNVSIESYIEAAMFLANNSLEA
ncbi:4-hydroxythreonine-4-phosphate dehydrogenase [Helicobacter sp. MIT 14-3879]|uniref:4-hydroxythreonine-4-phosphate dehydrogenase n=1 Tax=Helicobacter sp. MIT 14-3879 TaxID=2040649 RepID=UPI000E1FA4D7|nr:4-hydroxythreonine-4-phosphate dehydrogenase [Helicobacter sp. MIT 14-3879]RDU64691.1 4-hydroxythreonine-4-phosphate dehydrogenase [Helicobacter sp. MIT 14-3879]